MELTLELALGILSVLALIALIVFLVYLTYKVSRGGIVTSVEQEDTPLPPPVRPTTGRPPAQQRPDKPAVLNRPDYDQDKYKDGPPVIDPPPPPVEEIDPSKFWNKVWRLSISFRNNETLMKRSLSDVEFNYWKAHPWEFQEGAPVLYKADGTKT